MFYKGLPRQLIINYQESATTAAKSLHPHHLSLATETNVIGHAKCASGQPRNKLRKTPSKAVAFQMLQTPDLAESQLLK